MKTQMEAVLVCCKYYDFIINFHYPTYDYVTEKLINIYQEFIFGMNPDDKKALAMARQLDQVMYVYLTTKHFYQMVQNYDMNGTSMIFEDAADIIALYHDYIKDEMKSTSTTKWI